MYTHYRGTPFQFTGVLQDDGIVQDLTNCVLLASVFDKPGQNKYGDLNINVIDPIQGLVEVSYPDTSSWPVGIARIDFTLQIPENDKPLATPPDFFRIAQTPMIG